MSEIETTTPEIISTLQDRHSRYGTFADQAKFVQELRAFLKSNAGWKRLEHDQAEALEIIAQKISRILSGDPNYGDNWHDIAGYARLVEMRLNGQNI